MFYLVCVGDVCGHEVRNSLKSFGNGGEAINI